MRHLFDLAVAAENFNGNQLLQAVLPELPLSPPLHQSFLAIEDQLGQADARQVLSAILRFAFLIELVKTPKIETTKFEVRWADRLGADDPRFADYNSCVAILRATLASLVEAMADQENRSLLGLFREQRLLPYEIPLDYASRSVTGPIHHPSNVTWLWGEVPRTTLRLRAYLRGTSEHGYQALFAKVYADKIRVKTYLTDRVLTGAHKTNREKRWEAHPASVHFALRHDCLAVERTLIQQLCAFEDAPKDVQASLIAQGLLPPTTDVFRDPVTLAPLSFPAFAADVMNPKHGKSPFQVGHLNPLKAVNDDPQSGHTAQNISWISEDGNRMQGYRSIEETRTLIKRIAEEYARYGV